MKGKSYELKFIEWKLIFILHSINHIMRLGIVCIDCAYAFTPVTEGILFIELRNDDGKCWQMLANVVGNYGAPVE
jgi:hypothetical protein